MKVFYWPKGGGRLKRGLQQLPTTFWIKLFTFKVDYVAGPLFICLLL